MVDAQAPSQVSVADDDKKALIPKTEGAGKRKPKQKKTYMLHAVDTCECIGKMAGSDYRYSALKAASRGHKRIWVRQTNTKEMREYQGDIIKLATPKEVKRGDRTITYTQRPTVKLVNKWTYQGPTTGDDAEPTKAPEAV